MARDIHREHNRQPLIRELERTFDHDLEKWSRYKSMGDYNSANKWYEAAAKTAAILTALRNKTVLHQKTVHIPTITTWMGQDIHTLTPDQALDMVKRLWPKDPPYALPPADDGSRDGSAEQHER